MKPLPLPLALALFTLAGLTASASADLLAYEGFDPVSNADLDGQATTPEEDYFAGTESWSVSDDSDSDGWEGQTGGLTYPGLSTTGGHARGWRGNGSTFNDGVGADAVLDASSATTSTTHTELYFSALINADNLDVANSVAVAWDHESGSNNRLHGFEIRGSGDIYSFANASGVNTGLDLAAGTNLIVIRVTEKTLGSNNTDEYDLWLNPTSTTPGSADYSAPDGFNEGLVVGNGGFGFDGFFMKEALNNDPNEGGNNGEEQSVLVDELRLGTTFADVAVPEPASLALLGVGSLLVLSGRRRKA